MGMLCYAFSHFCKCRSTPDFLTCTDNKLQSWNKPRGRKVDSIPVERLCSRRSELTKKVQGNVCMIQDQCNLQVKIHYHWNIYDAIF